MITLTAASTQPGQVALNWKADFTPSGWHIDEKVGNVWRNVATTAGNANSFVLSSVKSSFVDSTVSEGTHTYRVWGGDQTSNEENVTVGHSEPQAEQPAWKKRK